MTDLERARNLKLQVYDESIDAFQKHIDFCLSEIENLQAAAKHMKPVADLIEQYQEQICRMQAAIDFRSQRHEKVGYCCPCARRVCRKAERRSA